MSKLGPIVIYEDDAEEVEILQLALERLNLQNKLLFFGEGEDLIQYLLHTEEQPFIIFSDVNVPKINGLELRERITTDEYLKQKSIPFIFLSNIARKREVERAFELNAQGFFVKEVTLDRIVGQLHQIISYWQASKHPNLPIGLV
jgi:CheY-like chemotaxis protein